MVQLHRLFKTAIKRIQRNPYNAFGAILVLFLTFFVGGILTLTSNASSIAINWYETRPQVTAFLKDTTTIPAIRIAFVILAKRSTIS